MIGTIIGLVVLMIGVDSAGLMTPQFRLIVNGFIEVVGLVSIYGGAAYMICQPTRPESAARCGGFRCSKESGCHHGIASFIYSTGTALTNIATDLSIPVTFAVFLSALSALTLVLLIGLAMIIIRTEARKGLGESDTTYFLIWILKFTPFIWILLAVAIIALLFGFIALALFIAGNILESAMLAVVLGVLHAFAMRLQMPPEIPVPAPGRSSNA